MGRISNIVTQLLAVAFVLTMLLSGCGKPLPEGSVDSDRIEVILQTDWFPQPEHGGFYQALAKGFYADVGLDVTILPGGPNSMSTQKVLKGSAHFAMNRADTIYTLACRKVGITMVMATLQHDPQALLLHRSNPIERFEDLDGQRVMANPGLAWIRWLEIKYNIRLNIIPHDFGIDRFLNDPSFIQQCLLTNEPFYVQQAGVEAKVLPLRDSGFDPYHGIYCLNEFAESNPALVQRFVEASIRGWRDYILNDPSPAFALIASKNPKMNPAFMEFSYRALRDQHLVTGAADDGSQVGNLDPARMDSLVREMRDLGLVEEPDVPDRPWYTTRFLTKPGDAPEHALP